MPHDFLQYKDSDSSELKALKSWGQMYLSMPKPERRLFIQEERVRDEEQYLKQMIEHNRESDDIVQEFTRKARSLVLDYGELKDKPMLEMAEHMTEFAELVKADKYTIGQIRKQREKIQWEKMRVAELTKDRTEPSKSSDDSKN